MGDLIDEKVNNWHDVVKEPVENSPLSTYYISMPFFFIDFGVLLWLLFLVEGKLI